MNILEDRDAWLQEFQEGWLKLFQETGETNWKIYNRPKNPEAPAGKGIDLPTSRLMLITTSGAYLKDSQQPFNAADKLGDYTLRTFPADTPLEALAFAHDHYNHTAVEADPQVLVPLRHLENMVQEGKIGEVASPAISIAGYMPYVTRLLDETLPQIVELVRAAKVQGALLVPA